MSNSIEKAEQRLNKGEQGKEDMALMLAPHANLIQQVAPTKLSLKTLKSMLMFAARSRLPPSPWQSWQSLPSSQLPTRTSSLRYFRCFVKIVAS